MLYTCDICGVLYTWLLLVMYVLLYIYWQDWIELEIPFDWSCTLYIGDQIKYLTVLMIMDQIQVWGTIIHMIEIHVHYGWLWTKLWKFMLFLLHVIMFGIQNIALIDNQKYVQDVDVPSFMNSWNFTNHSWSCIIKHCNYNYYMLIDWYICFVRWSLYKGIFWNLILWYKLSVQMKDNHHFCP